MTFDRLEWHLENWSIGMRHYDNKQGFSGKSSCFSSGGASGEDEFEIMCEAMDHRCAEIMGGIIDSLSLAQRTAVDHHWLGVSHCYPTQEMDYELALEAIGKLADKRGLI